MGQYLEIGIVTQVHVKKEKSLSKEEILKRIKEGINLNLYDINESLDNYLTLTLKKNVFEENIIEFLSEETFCGNKEHKERIQNTIRQINESQKDFNQIIEIMRENGLYYEEGCIFDNDLGFLFNDLDAYGDIISIEYDGKVILECYYSIFKYITDILRKSHNNILKDTLAITISG